MAERKANQAEIQSVTEREHCDQQFHNTTRVARRAILIQKMCPAVHLDRRELELLSDAQAAARGRRLACTSFHTPLRPSCWLVVEPLLSACLALFRQAKSTKPRHVSLAGEQFSLIVPHGLRLVALAFGFHGRRRRWLQNTFQRRRHWPLLWCGRMKESPAHQRIGSGGTPKPPQVCQYIRGQNLCYSFAFNQAACKLSAADFPVRRSLTYRT